MEKLVSEIHLIRHSITEGNIKRWYYGASDVPLLKEGIDLINELKEKGIYPKSEGASIYTSGMLRTEQTMETIYGKVPHEVIEELREFNFGDFEAKDYDELMKDERFVFWVSDKTNKLPAPNGDSRELFSKRVQKGFNKLIEIHRLSDLSHRHDRKPSQTIVVCHGGVIGNIMNRLFPGQREDMFRWIPDPGHGYTIEMNDGDPVSYREF